MNKKLLIAIAALVVLGGGGAAGYFFFLQGGQAQAAAPAPPEPGVVDLAPFLTNLASGGAHKARLQVTLAVTPKDLAASIGDDPLLRARIRDQILLKVSSSTYEELSSPAGKQALRDSIKRSVSALLEGGEVQEALFVDFVVQ